MMAKVRITQTAAQRRAFEEATAAALRDSGVQEQANETLRDVVRSVNAEAKGKPVALVAALLNARIAEARLRPVDGAVQQMAQAISDGTFEE